MHETDFLLQLGLVIAAALVGGLIARALKAPVLVGYLLAGIVVGPSTPGFIADPETVERISNVGVVLLMFAVGVQFSLRELGAVRKTALLAGSTQILGTTLLGVLLAFILPWGFLGGLFLGLALALSSTAVMMRVLEERGEMGSTHGAIMMGILILQDLAVVVMISLLPGIASLKEGGEGLLPIAISLLRAFLSVGLTLLLATKLIPFILRRITKTGSAELLLLTVVTLVFGAAILAEFAGLGMAIGAFLAGVVISESPFAHEIFSQVRPLRDVFSSIFFVSIGMLVDPRFVMREWSTVLLIVLAILVGKALITIAAVRMAGWHFRTAFVVGLGLAQIGEFSFVLANEALRQGIVDANVGSIIVSAALITLLYSPFLFSAAGGIYYRLARIPVLRPLLHQGKVERLPGDERHRPDARALVLGGGRVGRYTADALKRHGIPVLLIDFDAQAIERARDGGLSVLYGDATSPIVLEKANPDRAELAVVALPEAATTELAVKALRQLAPELKIVARVRRGTDIPKMREAGADAVVHGEFEAGVEMIRQAFGHMGEDNEAMHDYLRNLRMYRYRQEQH